MRQRVSTRLDASSKKETSSITAEMGTLLSGGKKNTTVKKAKVSALAVQAAVTIAKTNKEVAGGGDGDANDNGLGGVRDQLSGADLLDACDRLENDNLGLRQRLAKLELQKMQKEHGEDEEELNDDSQLAPVRLYSFYPNLCLIFGTRVGTIL